jgi:chromosome segregation ATPase
MSDSLDPIRNIAAGKSTTHAQDQLLALAILKLADENTELRNRVVSLELDRDAHTKRIDNAFYVSERLEELITDKAKRVENWADIIEAHGGAIDAHTERIGRHDGELTDLHVLTDSHTERLHVHDTDLVAWEHATDSLQRMHQRHSDRLTQLEQDCLIVSNQHVDRMGAIETWLGNVAEVVSRVEIRVSDIEADLRALTERITAYIQTNTEIAHTVLGLITKQADQIERAQQGVNTVATDLEHFAAHGELPPF